MLWRRRGLRHCWVVMGKVLMLRGGMIEEVVLVMIDDVVETGKEEMAEMVMVMIMVMAAVVEGMMREVIKMVEEEMEIAVEGAKEWAIGVTMMRGVEAMKDVQAIAEEMDE